MYGLWFSLVSTTVSNDNAVCTVMCSVYEAGCSQTAVEQWASRYVCFRESSWQRWGHNVLRNKRRIVHNSNETKCSLLLFRCYSVASLLRCCSSVWRGLYASLTLASWKMIKVISSLAVDVTFYLEIFFLAERWPVVNVRWFCILSFAIFIENHFVCCFGCRLPWHDGCSVLLPWQPCSWFSINIKRINYKQ